MCVNQRADLGHILGKRLVFAYPELPRDSCKVCRRASPRDEKGARVACASHQSQPPQSARRLCKCVQLSSLRPNCNFYRWRLLVAG